MKIGVLGGIGPFSSAYFYSELIKRIAEKPEVKHNSQYPQIIINSIPTPQLNNNVSEDDDNTALMKALVNGIKELSLLQPDFVVMICNTVHLFLDQIRKDSGFEPILDLRTIVREKLKTIVGSKETICVLGTPQTVKGGLYDFSDYFYHNPNEQELAQLNEIVYAYSTTGDFPKYSSELNAIIQKKLAQGVTLFILSCTEISLLAKSLNIKFLDTLDCLIDYVCGLAYTNILERLEMKAVNSCG